MMIVGNASALIQRKWLMKKMMDIGDEADEFKLAILTIFEIIRVSKML